MDDESSEKLSFEPVELPRADAGPYRGPAFVSERLVPPPVRSRRIAFVLAGAFLSFLLFTLISPWQQNVKGAGRVIAYAPLERRQSIEAPISGRVAEWFVREGSHVAEGDPIVRLSDNDAQLMGRLEVERESAADVLEQAQLREETQDSRLQAITRAQASAVLSHEARVRGAQQSLTSAEQSERAAEATFDTALLQLARQRALQEQGLVSGRQYELAQLAETRTRASRDSSRARARGAHEGLASARAQLAQARASSDSSIESARASVQSARSDAARARAGIARLDVRISRQQTQLVNAPRAGTIFRLLVNQGGEQVSPGDPLAILVPDTLDRAVEMWVDGNDAALVSAGRAVRLQFEGWPAVQFAGWPSVAVGTFGGRVAFVDSTDDGRGNFRVVVLPDPDDTPWPSTRFLRQGVRANGWLLLNRVSVGFEIWRQLNGFPPVLDPPPSTDPGANATAGGYGS